MKILRKKAPSRKGQTPKPVAEPIRIPAPIRGWVLNESLANPQPGGARILDNWICDLTTIRPRKGYRKHATVSLVGAFSADFSADFDNVPGSARIRSMWTYKAGANEKMFAATDAQIFDVTLPADPNLPPAVAVDSLANGDWYTQQFGTAGGDFLYAVNGENSPLLYNGSTFTAITGASSPAITNVTTTTLSHVWSFANRLFFVQKGTMSSWYLPVDSIGGAASQFSLAGVFKRGGALLFGATWSTDAGDGLNDQCLFFSTEGEVAIYRGTNPGDATNWSKVGVYEITKPIGPKAIMRAGGDLLVATEAGLVPLSEVLTKDVAALSLGAASRAIEPYWQKQAKALTSYKWQIAKWPAENIMIVTQPESVASQRTCLVANLQTGAWSRFTGLDTQAITVLGSTAYFGTTRGDVFRMEASGSDNGMPYTAAYLGQFEGFGLPGVQKTVLQSRPIFIANTPIIPQFRMRSDYDETLSPAPTAASFDVLDGWDYSTWDTSLWDAQGSFGVTARDSQWGAIGVTGYAHAPELQLTFGGIVAPDVEFIGADATFRMGAMVA